MEFVTLSEDHLDNVNILSENSLSEAQFSPPAGSNESSPNPGNRFPKSLHSSWSAS